LGHSWLFQTAWTRSTPLEELAGIPVHQAYLGSCTEERADDISIAAKILTGHRIHKTTKFMVVPASRQNKNNEAGKNSQYNNK